MTFREYSAGDPGIIGRMVYDVDGRYPLGVLQLVANHPESGWWITVRVDRPEEVQILHRNRVLVEDTGDEPPILGARLGSPGRHDRGEEAGASWKDRPGYDDDGTLDPEDPNVFPSTAAAEAASSSPDYRSPGTVRVHDFATGNRYELTPAGGPLGRTQGMTLENVKVRLAAVSDTLGNVGLRIGGIGQQMAERAAQLRGVLRGLERDLGMALAAINDLQEQRATAIAATAGHQVNTPAEALSTIDMAIGELEAMVARIRTAIQQVTDALTSVAAVSDQGHAVGAHCARAANIIDRYRTSF